MSNTANRWKSKGGISKRPANNITNTFNSVIGENIITNSLGAELTTIDKYGDIDDMKDAAIYKFDESSINFNNVVCYYPFNNLSYNPPLPAITTETAAIKNESTFDPLTDPNNYSLYIVDNPYYPTGPQKQWVVYDSQYQQNATQFRNNSHTLMSDASFNTTNTFGNTSSDASITTVMTLTSYINIPTGTEHFTIFAMDDLAQTRLLDASGEYLYLCFPGTNADSIGHPNPDLNKIQLIYRRVGGLGMTTSLYINEYVGAITFDTWHKFQLVFGGDYIAFYIDGEQTKHLPTSGGSFIPNQPISICLGPWYVDIIDASGNNTEGGTYITNTQTGDTGVQLLDYKIANYALNKDLIYFLANPGVGHQFVKSRIPNGAGELIYLLSKEAILFAPPTLCQNTLSVGGQLNSYGTNNFYSQSNFYDKATFYNGIVSDAPNTLVYDASAVSNINILSLDTATNEAASFMICNTGGMDPLPSNSMASMLVYNANQLQEKATLGTNNLVFSISGENVSVGPTFGTNTFDVKGISRFEGDVVMDDNLSILGAATIGQNADIGGDAIIGGNTEIGGYVDISGNTDISGNVDIGGNANIEGIATIAVNLGIGINPTCNLHILNDASGVNIQSWDHGNNRVLNLITPTLDNNAPFIFSTGNAYQFQTDNTVALDITAKGNVGIQKAANNAGPYALDVSGNVNVSGSINFSDNIYIQSNTSSSRIGIGYTAGQISQSDNCIAIGTQSGNASQGIEAIAIGTNAGSNAQGTNSVAIGTNAGIGTTIGQGANCIAMGLDAAQNNQGTNSIAIGNQAGLATQGNYSVAIGQNAGKTTQGLTCVAMGYLAGQTAQGNYSVAIGNSSGLTNQGQKCVSIGNQPAAGQTDQGESSIAIGSHAGTTSQGTNSIAIGPNTVCQNNSSVALGSGATTTTNNQIVLGTINETVSIPGSLNMSSGPIITSGRETCLGTGAFKSISFTTNFINVNPNDIAVVATAILSTQQSHDMVSFNIQSISLSGFEIIGSYKDGQNGQTGGGWYGGDFSYIATAMK